MMKMCLFHISSKNRKIIVLVFLALLLLLLLILLRCKSYVCAEGRGALSLIFRILSLSLSRVPALGVSYYAGKKNTSSDPLFFSL